MSEPTAGFRWQTFFQYAAQPIFLLSRRRRLLFVNRAWETCTGLKLADVRGRACRRRSAASALEQEDAILAACAPPREATGGSLCQAHRRAPVGAGWWEIQFQPLAGTEGLLGILGTIRVLTGPAETPLPLPEKLIALRDRQSARYRLGDIGTGSPALARVHEQAILAAQTRLPITILGEAGAGKEHLARAIHWHSDARQQPFACLDAERLPGELLGEMLFDRQFALGTAYVREPAALPREWQSRLAQTLVLRENPEFPRIILGMRGEPAPDIQNGRLLGELYYAASSLTIQMPPLRDRLGDLSRFISIFLERARELTPHGVQSVTGEALSLLRAHAWPGNLGELQEVMRSACRRAKGERIELADLPFYLKQAAAPADRHLPLDALLEQVERRLIALALKLAQDNQTRAAELLEIWRPRLLRRMEKLGFNVPPSE
ncbi:MAG TPA: sigma 54-interacting transcriptional regulator [Gemmataceae bacterium]|nr:sigma 54-interacting transcriptional regulator [Gemmataceae bacterium]